MKVKEASVTYGRKIQPRQFESAHAEITLFVEFDEGDDVDAVMRSLWEATRNNVKAELSRIVPDIRANAEEMFLGVPVSNNEKGE